MVRRAEVVLPKRVVDGEAMARSRKLASVQPVSARAEYPWWLTLAAPNGVFELDYQAIWAQLYAYGRPDRTVEDTRTIGEAFIAAKLLFVWAQGGKTFVFLVGSDKPGRCLPQSWISRAEKRGKLPPYPPKDQLNKFLDEPTSSPDLDAGKELACRGKEVARREQGTSLLGSGSGIGIGSGKTLLSEAGASDEEGSIDSVPVTQTTKPPPSETGLLLSNLLRDRMLANNPGARITIGQIGAWAHTADLMLRIDRRTEQQIAAMIEWSQKDEFWRKNILSMEKLRQQFDQLTLRSQSGGTNGINRGSSKSSGALSAPAGKYDTCKPTVVAV
jgi:hypothetical protein